MGCGDFSFVNLFRVILFLAIINILLVSKVFAFTKKNAEFNRADFKYNIGHVIVNQPYEKPAGIISETNIALDFNDGMHYQIEKLIRGIIPEVQDLKKITVVVDELITVLSSTYSHTDVSISFYEQDQVGNFIEIFRTGGMYAYGWSNLFTGMSLNEACDRALRIALKRSFQDFVTRDNQGRLTNRNVGNKLPLSKSRIDAMRFPILKNMPTKGVIYSFSDFLDNEIDSEVDFTILRGGSSPNSPRYYRVDSPNYTEVWGVCDGEKYYRKLGDLYYPLDIIDDSIFLFCPNITSEEEAFMTGGLAGFIERDKPRQSIISNKRHTIRAPMNVYTGRVIYPLDSYALNIECIVKKGQPEVCIIPKEILKTLCLVNNEFVRLEYNPFEVVVGIEMFSGTLRTTYYFQPNNTKRILVGRRKSGIFFRALNSLYFGKNHYLGKQEVSF